MKPPAFELNVDEVFAAVTEKTRAVLVNTPGNPFGNIIDSDTLAALHNVGSAHRAAGDVEAALLVERSAAEWRASELGEHHPGTMLSLNNYARSLEAAGRLDEAHASYERLLESAREGLEETHWYRGLFALNVASFSRSQREWQQAEELAREAVEVLGHEPGLHGAIDIERLELRLDLVVERVHHAFAQHRYLVSC